ncbi:hypothetical protein CSB45_13070 [candidate division KSB3 bacterium]|uniref:Uncharacterized protein n=1 Tax=candidate division KSB3 bacterium TaxID=2044937 RepID=A0A2G6E251_9BACT|nr:MAG: hypothetical protein CSB45_13070 [candidate division KSB3 bacterium]PIE28631.1 MAG: hypothetical protein CSA57_12725 [candidate division KSB3 bacterium]
MPEFLFPAFIRFGSVLVKLCSHAFLLAHWQQRAAFLQPVAPIPALPDSGQSQIMRDLSALAPARAAELEFFLTGRLQEQ